MTTAKQTGAVLQLDPAVILQEHNIRFGLKQSRIDAMAASIAEQGGVLTPVLVRKLATPQNGFTHQLVVGFYRVAGVSKLNETGAGLTVPALESSADSDRAVLMQQIAENNERENMSLLDTAVAIRKLMEAGVERKEIRRIFARSTGQKGTTITPASNAWVNMVLKLLDLPKKVQDLIHNGVIGLSGAYALSKVDPEKRDAIVERALAERDRFEKEEEKDEAALIKLEASAAEVEGKLTEALTEEETLRAGVQAASESTKEATEAFRTLQKANYLEYPEKEKAEHRKKLSEAEGAVKAAQKAEKDAKNKLATHLERKHKLETAVQESRAKLEAAQRAKKAEGKTKAEKGKGKTGGLSEADINKAAQAEGENKYVPLNLSEIRSMLRAMAAQKSAKKVAHIGAVLNRIVSGELTDAQGFKDIAIIAGDLKGTPETPEPGEKAPTATEAAAKQAKPKKAAKGKK